MALTLRTVGGLTSEEIARASLVPVPTIQARITRAKKTIAAARVPFELTRAAIDDVSRGSNDSVWQPLKDAARQIALAEDR
uniref:encapsulin n=1 Tax=Rodentibacter caecimuris TaxID=1796644 RepID=UPI00366EE85E